MSYQSAPTRDMENVTGELKATADAGILTSLFAMAYQFEPTREMQNVTGEPKTIADAGSLTSRFPRSYQFGSPRVVSFTGEPQTIADAGFQSCKTFSCRLFGWATCFLLPSALFMAFRIISTPESTGEAVLSVPYNEAESLKYLQYARATFCQASKLKHWTCGDICEAAPVAHDWKQALIGQGSASVRMIGPGSAFDVQGYVALLPEEPGESALSIPKRRCILAFRGSVDLANWEADFLFLPKEWPPKQWGKRWCPNCRVHDGFASAYEELKDEIFSGIHDFNCSEVSVTGHSLGAALAILSTFELRIFGMFVSPVYVFGAPRVGNSAFVDAFIAASKAKDIDPPLWRVVHDCDPVPRLPPQTQPFGYRHEPREVYYNTEASNHYRTCDPASGEDPNCSLAVPLPECIMSSDHLTYLNLTLAHKQLPQQCIDPYFVLPSVDMDT